jgi:hypothetical protein
MEKIVIISDQQKRSSWLASLLKTLFPECDVSIVSGKRKVDKKHERRHDPTIKLADTDDYVGQE